MVPNGMRYSEGVPRVLPKYMEFLDRYGVRCSFFVTGEISRRYPELIQELVNRGHELACHTSDHMPLNKLDTESFRDDLRRNIDDLKAAGTKQINGFRAPMASVTRETRWAYDVLAELGFIYSSSVLPARNLLYGWPGFPRLPMRTENGIWELPFSLSGIPGLDVPFAAGVYFRVLPFVFIRHLFKREIIAGHPVIGYFHPYDIDTKQERFMMLGIEGNRFYNWLMYRNRADMIRRLNKLMSLGAPIVRYIDYVQNVLERVEIDRA